MAWQYVMFYKNRVGTVYFVIMSRLRKFDPNLKLCQYFDAGCYTHKTFIVSAFPPDALWLTISNEMYLLLFAGQNVQVRPGGLPQVVQFPAMQQTVPVQVPIQTANGQTIYQTVHVPLQAFAGQMPGLVQPQMQIFPQIAQVR